MYEYPFEKLKIWQNGKDLVRSIYQESGKFPSKEKNEMGQYLRASSVRLTASLSEGNWKTSNDQARHSIDRAHLCLMEVLSLIIVSRDLDFMAEETYTSIRSKINDLSIMLLAFKKSLGSKAEKKVNDNLVEA